ncbi:MAG: metallopeptidase TldD-related protein [Lachnospiraceae bacterium]
MIECIKSALKENHISVYRINEKVTESLELFFIKKHLDMRRGVKVTEYKVTVYRDFEAEGEKYRGSAVVVISDGMSAEEVSEKIKDAYYAASFVKNRWYPIPAGEKVAGIKECKTNLADCFEENVTRMAEAIFSVDTEKDVFLNSLEIFASRSETRIVNSEGVDVAYRRYLVSGEFVAQCLEPQDVETYENFHYDSFDEEDIKEKVKRVLKMTKDRAVADTAPAAGDYRVILSGRQVAVLFDYYYNRANAGYVYPGYSNYKVGDDVQMAGNDAPVCGERLTVSLKATTPYSNEGIPMVDRTLISDGKLAMIFGDTRFCYYLGVEPTGYYEKTVVKEGTVPFEDMKKTPYLYVVNFSDFQMDAMSGNFGGEIRLAYLFDGEKVTPVTGGSINGNIIKAQKNFVFSKETQENMEFAGPFAVSMEGIAVAGC